MDEIHSWIHCSQCLFLENSWNLTNFLIYGLFKASYRLLSHIVQYRVIFFKWGKVLRHQIFIMQFEDKPKLVYTCKLFDIWYSRKKNIFDQFWIQFSIVDHFQSIKFISFFHNSEFLNYAQKKLILVKKLNVSLLLSLIWIF